MSPGEAAVRLAVVGVGHLGRHHTRLAAALPGVALVGIHDHHGGRAEEVAREGGLAVLSGPEEIARKAQAVIIATPTSTHAELARFFLERGLDVLVEKPIASSLTEARALVALARSRGRILQVGHVERYNPAVQAVLSVAKDPVFIEGHRLAAFTPRGLDVDVVRDLMIHDLQIVSDLVRRPVREVRAAGVPTLTAQVDIASARIVFAGGCVANLTASRVSFERVRKLRVFSRGLYCSIDMDSRTVEAHGLEHGPDGPRIVPVDVGVREGDPLACEQADFVEAVRQRRDPLVSGETGLIALELAERVLAAIDEHRRSAAEVGP